MWTASSFWQKPCCLMRIHRSLSHTVRKWNASETINLTWPDCKVCLCVWSGFLLGNLPEEHLSHLNMGTITKGEAMESFHFLQNLRLFLSTDFNHVVMSLMRSCTGLVMLLQDPDPVVRVKAAEAMGHFHWYTHTHTHTHNSTYKY